MWLFVQSRPYYPNVEEHSTRDEAEQAMAAFLEDEGDGEHETVVYVAEVARRETTRTEY